MQIDNSSLTDKVTQKLRDAIINLDYLPGQHLTQAIISEKYSVSHIPARESLMKLESEGYVFQLPYRGAIVSPFSPTELDDILKIRISLEGLVMKEAMENINAELLSKLDKGIAKILSTKSPLTLVKAHNDFYNTLFNFPTRLYWSHMYNLNNHRFLRYIGIYLKITTPATMTGTPTLQEVFEQLKKREVEKVSQLLSQRYSSIIEIIKIGIGSYL